ncbi:NUDIX hydrolase [Ruegeria arenilitoris]|uniref:NUDIX hydrolase n=1 Tax=Ruegeria arenilitoris TaxID=1173585 RepID=UPI00147D63FA|nr:NUDIX hydrolase [Ruegeria arenilitoris]
MDIERTIQASAKVANLPVFEQSAALCYRFTKGKPEILLITTRRSGKWIIPKGWPTKGLTSGQSAALEAWEEAGVSGMCANAPLGQFSYVKTRSGVGPAQFVVDVFPLHVRRLSAKYPENDVRRRKWYSPKKASHRVILPGLAVLLQGFAPKLN